MIDKIKTIYNNISNKKILYSYFKNNYPDLFEFIINNTSFLKDNPKESIKKDGSRVPFIARIIALLNGITKQPTCVICGKNSYYNHHLKNFSKWCSIKCSVNDPNTKALKQKTINDNYDEFLKNKTIKNKSTRYKKYNGSYTSSNFKSKIKQTKLERYGDENYNNHEQSKQTKLERYDNENYNNHEQSKNTKLKKYGNENYNNHEQIHLSLLSLSNEEKQLINEKRKSTCNKKYGVDNINQLTEISNKKKNTNIKKYGVSNPLLLDNNRKKLNNSLRNISYEFLLSFAKNNNLTLLNSKEEFLNVNQLDKFIFTWKCNNCNTVFNSRYDNGQCVRICPNCSEDYSKKRQYEIYQFLKTLINDEIICNDRNVIKPLELDFYIPSRNIAIEFNGLYWHDENHKPNNYHLNKTNLCNQHGIRLIHIFEDEWIYNKQIIKNKLKNIFTSYKKIYARKCSVINISNELKNKFLNKYHLQGCDISNIRLGLLYKNHLVAVMTFTKSRFNKSYEYELSRYATIFSFKIIGGAGKLLSAFEKIYKPKSIITYADKRWSIGNLYYKLNFSYIGDSNPSYYYIKNNIRYNRIRFQKHKLKHIFEDYDDNLSEHDIMRNHGYFRIYDCGNMVFVKKY